MGLRVCLVSPPSPFLLDDRVFPSLGVLQVAAALEAAGHDVFVSDLGGVKDCSHEMAGIARIGWDVYGVTATTPQFPTAVDLAGVIRAFDPGKRLIIGGAHATVMPESCSMFDVVVRGDGEGAVLDALKVPNGSVLDAATTTSKGVLAWRWPARHLIDMSTYKYKLHGVSGTSMMWSMGCPYGCVYCCGRTLAYYRRVRSRLASDVVREAEHLVSEYGIGSVTAFDDEVNLLNEPLIELCKALTPLGLKYRAFVKANLFTDLQADVMAKAGFVEVCTGVESGDDRVLGIMQKQTSREVNKRFIDIAHKHGMKAKAFCSLGHPGETYESAMNLKDWLLWAKPDDFDVTVITVYPGTRLYEDRQYLYTDESGHRVCQYVHRSRRDDENGAILYFEEVDYAREFVFYKGRPKEYVSHVWTPDLGKADLARLRDAIEDDVRTVLKIPYPRKYSGDYLDSEGNFNHSMGAGLSPQDSRAARRGESSVRA